MSHPGFPKLSSSRGLSELRMFMVKTIILDATGKAGAELKATILPAVRALQADDAVGMPTETVYGLAANALSAEAVSKIYSIKKRPTDNPLIVHIANLEMLRMLVPRRPLEMDAMRPVLEDLDIPTTLIPILQTYWPGPLTVLLKRLHSLPENVTAGLDTVAVRFPSHPVAQALIAQSGLPLAAPSANLSGRPSPTTAMHVKDDLNGLLEYIIDGGSCGFGLESTVLDATRSPPLILRPGSITAKMLHPFLPDACVFRRTSNMSSEEATQIEERPPTPGMKYRHYSPTSPLFLFVGAEADTELRNSRIDAFISSELARGQSVVRLVMRDSLAFGDGEKYHEISLTHSGDLEETARNLFAGLRAADSLNPDLIVAESVIEQDEGLAIMNRLGKAASSTIQISQTKAEASKPSNASGKAKKKKWSKGKVKEKANNAVTIDKATMDKLLKEVPTYKLITCAILMDRLKINGSAARFALAELESKGLIKRVHGSASLNIYTRATAIVEEPVAAAPAK